MGRFTLNLNGPFIKLPEKLAAEEPTHVSRYWLTGSFIDQLAQQFGLKNPKILDVGGLNGLLSDFGFKERIELDVQPIQKPNYVQGSALSMPFKDNSFDFVVACDVFEHIPTEDRQQFLKELYRVAKHSVILCAPFNTPGVPEAESWANNFYKSLSGQDHPWLIEHINNGLPREAEVEDFLSSERAHFVKARHLSLENWRLILRLDLLRAIFGNNNILQTHAHIVYNQYLKNECAKDFNENSYRTFYILSKNGRLGLLPVVRGRKAPPTPSKASVEGLLNMITAFCMSNKNHLLTDGQG
jgi:SAM-dependent methyltransferase